ncbi:MAG: YhbY family RNA-binding protein [Candidatus Binatia bacterium]|nr:YhbY family RNA-binding protein [Candidatus Binatia bacterium]
MVKHENSTRGADESGASEATIPLGARGPAPVLTGKQRKLLRGRAHHLAAVVRVGQQGTTAAVLRAVEEALAAHELVKVRCHRPEDKRRWARELAEATGAALCGLIGHTAILYRPRPEAEAAQPSEANPDEG